MTNLNGEELYPIRENEKLLNILLKDRTTEQNILWATDSYNYVDTRFREKDHIELEIFKGHPYRIIKRRIIKDIEEKLMRTKEKGEVYTPTWIVKKKLDLIEKEIGDLNFEEYIDYRYLEITCGEAPYITSRYDTVTGKYIDVEKRVGFLDRKIQKISKSIDNKKLWLDLVIRAYKSSYGYEYQGDSLFIARENLLLSFIEYYNSKFSCLPELKDMETVAEIISYNIFQMDGLKYTIPVVADIKPQKENIQLNFLEDVKEEQAQLEFVEKLKEVRIIDWRNNKTVKFKDSFKRKRRKESMKFDVVIGNPPYQETISKSKTQSQANTSWIYHHFQQSADEIGDITCLIYPFGGWFDNHRALNKLGKRLLSDGHTRVIKAYEGSDDRRAWYREDKKPDPIFGKEIDLSAGVSIVIRNMTKKFDSYLYSNRIYSDNVRRIYFSDNINIFPSPDFTFGHKLFGKKLQERLKKNIFKIESSFVELNPDKVSLNKNDFKDPILLLTNNKSGSAGRAKKFYCERSLIEYGKEYIDYYKVIMPSAYPKKTLTTGGPNIKNVKQRLKEKVEILPRKSAYGRSRMMLFYSKNKSEISNFIKYTRTNFFAFLVLQEPNRTSSIGQVIPDQDFTLNSDIDWSKSIYEIDQQLYKKYNLTDKEIDFIESNIKEME